jgi:hypothetical protein
MKLFGSLLFASMLFASATVFAQVDDSTAPPADLPQPTEETVAPAAAAPRPQAAAAPGVPATARVAPPRRVAAPDSIKGNARNDIQMIEAKESCANGLKSMALFNKSTTRPMKVKVEINVNFSGTSGGHTSQKFIIVDNLTMNETRIIGCGGCVNNPTGKVCTTYKIIAAVYK